MSYYTYNEGRKCKHCNTPIADQAHAAQLYCPRTVLSDNSIKSCRDDFNTTLRKKEQSVYRNLIKYHRLTHRRIQTLLKTKGEKVTEEDINRCGINLSMPLQFEIQKNKLFLFYFNEFAIEQLAESKFKIYSHGRLF